MSPTEKQIELVEVICKQLHITDFPSCSKEFTKNAYSNFINWAISQSKTPNDWEPDGYDYEYWDAVLGEQY